MPTSLATLTLQLQADIPALHAIPSADQARQAVQDAIADLSRRQPRPATTTIAVTAGQATYALPADCLRLVRLADLPLQRGMLILDEGLVPCGWATGAAETLTIQDGALTMTPTPAYTATRTLVYSAGDLLAADGDTYATLTADRAQLAMHKARAIVLLLQASRAAADAWLSELGPEKVDKTKQADALRAAAAMWQAQYDAATSQAGVPYGSRS